MCVSTPPQQQKNIYSPVKALFIQTRYASEANNNFDNNNIVHSN